MCQRVSEPQLFRPVLISIDCVSQLWDSARGSALKFCSEEWQLAGETPPWRRRRERCRGSQLLLFHHHSTVQQREMAGSEEERDLATSLIRKHWKVELSQKLWGSFFQEKNILFWFFSQSNSGCITKTCFISIDVSMFHKETGAYSNWRSLDTEGSAATKCPPRRFTKMDHLGKHLWNSCHKYLGIAITIAGR